MNSAVVLIDFCFALFYLSLGCIAAYLVYNDRKKKDENIWHPGRRSMGPIRWAIIMFVTGGMAIGLYWFIMYQKAFQQLIAESRKAANQNLKT